MLTLLVEGTPDLPGAIVVAGSPGALRGSVADAVVLGREPRRLGLVLRREAERAAASLLDEVGLSVDVRSPAAALDHVGRRVVALARAIGLAADDAPIVVPRTDEDLIGEDAARWTDAVTAAARRHDVLLEVAWPPEPVPGALVAAVRGGAVADARPVDAPGALLGLLPEEGEPERPSPGRAGDALLEVSGLSVLHPVHPGRLVLDGVRLTARAGEVTGVCGSGADELLLALGGAYGAVSGPVLLRDVRGDRTDVAGRSREGLAARGLAVTGQRLPSYDLGLVGGMPTRVSAERLTRLAASGLIDRSRDYPPAAPSAVLDAVSAVARRHDPREAFESAFATFRGLEPRVLLVVAPLSGLSTAEAPARVRLVRSLAEAGHAVVVSGTPRELVALADDVVPLVRGASEARIPRAEVSVARLRDVPQSRRDARR